MCHFSLQILFKTFFRPDTYLTSYARDTHVDLKCPSSLPYFNLNCNYSINFTKTLSIKFHFMQTDGPTAISTGAPQSSQRP
jgi:hypothetical protein